ncbi:hypothetical protein [Henriciella sp.]|uniref:hypothetical protein n=1 Tax=Henriciella sp. TaxID=1968823 RepID=UPI002630E143|nr:hypothetical protein [Henriciella sp.]
MFKRPRLSAQTFPVNAGVAGFLLFYAVSCSGPQEPAEPTPDQSQAPAPEQPRDQAEEQAIPPGSLPAVWMTRTLDRPIRSIGITGGAGSSFAVAYETGGLQLFNFDAERLTSISDHDVKALAEGRYVMISGTPVTLYPGIGSEGDMKVWIYGGGLSEAIEYDLKGGDGASLAGMCTTRPETGSDALIRIAYWTEASSTMLEVGDLVERNEELEWVKTSELSADQAITACTFTDGEPETFTSPVAGAAGLKRFNERTLVTLGEDGAIDVRDSEGETERYDILDGITVVVPDQPKAIAATGDARGGGYPGGLIVLGGDIEPGDHRVVMVDPSKITLTPLTAPVAGQ